VIPSARKPEKSVGRPSSPWSPNRGGLENLDDGISGFPASTGLAALRMLFDWLVIGQVMPANLTPAVRGPKHVVKTGKTLVFEGDEWRRLLDAIPTETVRDLRDWALIATLTHSLAPIDAALAMKVEDLRPRGDGWTVRLHEKGGKHYVMPCHHALAEMLHAYIAAARIGEDPKACCSGPRRGTTARTSRPNR
jgi:site-specific recombinase XerD